MLYVDALCRGIDPLPTVSEAVRREMYDRLEREGLASLLQELRRLDPVYGAQVDPCNAKRVVHALEIIKESGRPFSELRTGTKKERPFRVVKIGLSRPREELFDRINRRGRISRRSAPRVALPRLQRAEHRRLQRNLPLFRRRMAA